MYPERFFHAPSAGRIAPGGIIPDRDCHRPERANRTQCRDPLQAKTPEPPTETGRPYTGSETLPVAGEDASAPSKGFLQASPA